MLRKTGRIFFLAGLFSLLILNTAFSSELSRNQKLILEGARSRLGDRYDSGYYSYGYPPQGRSACVDVLYFAFKKIGIDLQVEVNRDMRQNPGPYPAHRDYAINHRWAPNLFVWFKRHARSFSGKSLSEWEPGDVIFWSLTGDGVADHCGIVSDKKNPDGRPLVVHQFPPTCREEDVLNRWQIMGHFRLPGK